MSSRNRTRSPSAAGVLWSVVLACMAVPALADPPDPFANDVTAIKARHIITVDSKTIDNGIVIVRNGKIAALGADVKVPLGAVVMQCDTVMPGIVGIASQIGISAESAGPAALPQGGAGRGGPPGGGARTAVANPHFRVEDELYPFDSNWEKLVREGVTTLSLVPGGSGIPGQGAIIHPFGDSAEAMTMAASASLAVHFAANTQTMDLIRNTFEGARPQQADPNADPLSDFSDDGSFKPGAADTQVRRGQGRGGFRPAAPTGPATGNQQARLEPVQRAFAGTIPTIITCPDNASVAYALPLFAAFDKVNPIYMLTSEDSSRVAALMGEKGRNVVLGAALYLEPLTTNRINVVAEFVKAGARVACRPVTDDVEGYRTLRFQMGQLIKAGLDADSAISAITLTPAQMLGISTKVGSIAVGRDADLLLLDGGPFEPSTRIRKVLIDGKVAFNGE